MNRSLLLILVVMFACLEGGGSAYAIEVAPRITDREIIEGLAAIRGDIKRLDENIKRLDENIKRLDEGQKTLQKQLEDTRAGLQKQIDDTRHELKEFMLGGFGVSFSGMFALIGFVLWDRRTALAPTVAKTRELEDREERLERAMKELAQQDSRVAEALRHAGLL